MEENRIIPGEVKFNKVQIIANGAQIDVSRLITKMNLYENIMSPFITGYMILSETQGLAEILPLMGEEIVNIDVENPGFSESGEQYRKTGMFHIYKMTGKEDARLQNIVYTLYFVSIEGFIDINSSISRTFRGKISSTVNNLLLSNDGLHTSKDYFIESTTNNEVHTSNFWSPTRNIYYLSSKAINKNGNPNFVFFENNEGFKFISLDMINEQAPKWTFIKDQHSRQANDPDNPVIEYMKILDMSTPIFFDYYDKLQSGAYGGSIYKYDIQQKSMNYAVRVGKADFTSQNLNEYLAIQDTLQFNPEAAIKLTHVIHKNLYNDSPAPLPVDHSLRRMVLLSRETMFQTTIHVFGRFDYSVGQAIMLIIYSNKDREDGSEEGLYDEVMSGKWIITAINHEITHDAHYSFIEISKDSMVKSL